MSQNYRSAHQPPRNGSLLRLTAAALLFLTCLGLKTCFPSETAEVRQQLSSLLSASTDFQAAFSSLGERLDSGEDVMAAVGDWCVTVFAPQPITMEDASSSA